ncbi:hypothetical protein ABI260_09105 [Pseudomonas guguanensis]|uniref:hypothetical protein n=1 Tax=Ectopseudomonas guguanensis TaxID=1198456 RepID=UPI0032664A19
MKKPQSDFEYISELLEDFFKQRELRKSFRIIFDREITGWEIWFQIEFARFLADHSSEPEWGREYSFQFDYRRESTRSFLKPDFIIRKKGWAKDRYVALEIKQHAKLGNCVSNMIGDLSKVAKMRKSEIDLRSYWALGIFQTDLDLDVETVVTTKLQESGLEYHPSVSSMNKISRTPYSYVLF